VEKLTIHAASPASGRAMLAALSGFRAELLESADGCEVVVSLGRDDSEIVAVLNALEQHITERASGPARIDLNGRSYFMHPEPDSV
jgi:hypothetical protein